MQTPGIVGAAVVAVVALAACGQGSSGDAGSGGTSGTGAAASSGGSSSGGGTTSGGATAAGGATDTGGEGGATSSGGTAPSGCEGPAGSSGVQELSIDVDGQTRTFVLSVPDGYDGASALPLVFAWHGAGGSGSLARLYFGVEQAAAGAAIFVYPDGLPDDEDETGWDLADDGIDVAFFDHLLEEVSADYCVDANRVFSIGHSFGGYMTNRLGCSRGGVLRGVGPVAGGPHFGGGDCDEPIAAFMVHGTFDEVVLLEQGELAREDYLGRSQCGETSMPVDPAPCVQYDACASEHPIVWCEHDTAAQDAHGWPDFVAAGMWDFLSSLP